MTVRNLSLSEDVEQFVQEELNTGRFPDANAVLEDALREKDRRRQEQKRKLAELRQALDEGEQSPIVEGDPFEQARARLNLPSRKRA